MDDNLCILEIKDPPIDLVKAFLCAVSFRYPLENYDCQEHFLDGDGEQVWDENGDWVIHYPIVKEDLATIQRVMQTFNVEYNILPLV